MNVRILSQSRVRQFAVSEVYGPTRFRTQSIGVTGGGVANATSSRIGSASGTSPWAFARSFENLTSSSSSSSVWKAESGIGEWTGVGRIDGPVSESPYPMGAGTSGAMT